MKTHFDKRLMATRPQVEGERLNDILQNKDFPYNPSPKRSILRMIKRDVFHGKRLCDDAQTESNFGTSTR